MNLIGQAAKKILDCVSELQFQVVMFGDSAIYLEGVRPLVIGDERITFRTRSQLLTVDGENLSICEYFDESVSVVGKIKSVEVFANE